MDIPDKLKRHFCYKSISIPQGIVLLFETYNEFADSEFRINYFDGMLYIELGENVFLLTENMLDHLLKAPYICICKGNTEHYDISTVVKELEVSQADLAQIKGAITIITRQQQQLVS